MIETPPPRPKATTNIVVKTDNRGKKIEGERAPTAAFVYTVFALNVYVVSRVDPNVVTRRLEEFEYCCWRVALIAGSEGPEAAFAIENVASVAPPFAVSCERTTVIRARGMLRIVASLVWRSVMVL